MTDTNIRRESHTITADDIRALLQPTTKPCISIYIRTAPSANADQGRIRFKTAVQQVQADLKRNQQPGQEEPFLQPLRDLADRSDFWLSQRHGLAVFYSPDVFELRRLPEPPRQDLTIVADSFHVKPLLRLAQHAGRFQVLAVTVERVRLYEGMFQRLEEIPLHPDVPSSMEEALGEPNRVSKLKRAPWEPEDSDTRDKQLTRYFRRLDEAVWEHHSRPSGLPLLLAALPEYHSFFHQASRNQHLIKEGIKRDPVKDIDAEGLAREAWELYQPVRAARIADLRERFGLGRSQNGASDQLDEVARQAVFGKVGTLILRENFRVGGTVDRGTGEITRRPIEETNTDDLLDDLAEIVLSNSGEVLVLGADEMIGDTGIAAIYRYAT